MIKLCLRKIVWQSQRKLSAFSFSDSKFLIKAQDLVSPLNLKTNIFNTELSNLIDYVSALNLKIVTPFYLQKCYDELKEEFNVNEHKINWFFFLFLIYAKTQNREYICQFSKYRLELNTLLSAFENNIYLTLKKERHPNEQFSYDECFNYFKALLCNLVLENKFEREKSAEFEVLRKDVLLAIKYVSKNPNPYKIKSTSVILCMIFILEIHKLTNSYTNPKLDHFYLKNLFALIKKHINLHQHYFQCVLDDLEHLNSCLPKSSNFDLGEISYAKTFFLTPLGLKYFFQMMKDNSFYSNKVKNVLSELSLILPFPLALKQDIILSFFDISIINQEYSHLIFYCLPDLIRANKQDFNLETFQKLTFMASRKNFYIQNFKSMRDFWIEALHVFKNKEPFLSSFYLNVLSFSFSKVSYVFPGMKEIFEKRLRKMDKLQNFCPEQILFLTAGFNLGYLNKRNIENIFIKFLPRNNPIMNIESILGLGSLFIKMKVFNQFFWNFFFEKAPNCKNFERNKQFQFYYILKNFQIIFEIDYKEKRRIKYQQKYPELYKNYLKVKEDPELKNLLTDHVLSFKASFAQDQCTLLEGKIIKLLKERKIEYHVQFPSMICFYFYFKSI